MKFWLCFFFGHRLERIGVPLYSQCARCGAGFFTDYFESRALGRIVRVRVSAAELARAKADP